MELKSKIQIITISKLRKIFSGHKIEEGLNHNRKSKMLNFQMLENLFKSNKIIKCLILYKKILLIETLLIKLKNLQI